MAGFSNVSTAAVHITSSTPGRRRLLSLQLGTLVQFPAGASTMPATTLRAALAADASQVGDSRQRRWVGFWGFGACVWD